MIDEKGLEAAVASLEPKCRGFCGGSSQLTWNVADELARAAITAYLSTRSAEPVAWEFFQDKSYFGMWCVREVGASRFGDGFHVVSQEEARALRAALSAAAIRKG